MQYTTSGYNNTALGAGALNANTTAYGNTATGYSALVNTQSDNNTGTGNESLFFNTTGDDNTALGTGSLYGNTTGDSNIGIGYTGGENITTGSNNIEIGNAGAAADSDVIRIGVQGTQTQTFLAGIYSTAITSGRTVVVNSNGQLGTSASSERFKRDIHDMGDTSDALMKLRPVTFRYKDDSVEMQYGLIAEEVEPVYPNLVTYGNDGKLDGVRYEELPAMLLNEVQKEVRENRRQAQEIKNLKAQIAELKKKDAEIDALTEWMNALEQQALRTSAPEHLASATR